MGAEPWVLARYVDGLSATSGGGGGFMVTHDASDDDVTCRPAVAADSADLAVLADAATRRLVSWLWDVTTTTGQSSFEVGRATINSNSDSLSHFSRWRVAECDGRMAGACNSYLLPPVERSGSAEVRDVLVPLTELKTIALGTWYVSVASVFPESRSRGVGRGLLADAEAIASVAGAERLTLIVASFNPRARRLYEAIGFEEWDRRTFRPFPGSGEAGDWILMSKLTRPH